MSFARADLLALSADDLVVLSNRGLAKRAAQEWEAGALRCEIDEDAEGRVAFRWSDGVECVVPAGSVVSDARCSCPATSMCRHVVRSVLAYQAGAKSGEGPGVSEAASGPWDPGAIADDRLVAIFGAAALAKARRAFDDGLVVELVRGAKPSAIFQTLSVSLRFLVPGDARYTHCDCADPAPCGHVPLAVWAFRMVDGAASGGIVETRAHPLPVPEALLADVERALGDLCVEGISGGHAVLADRLRRLEERARAEGLAWPAEILSEIAEQCRAYAEHDARFSPTAVAELFGEWCIRASAIRSATGAVPQLFVRGSSADRVTPVSAARLVGLGCGVQAKRGTVEVSAYLQDVDSGVVVAVRRATADPAAASGEEPKSFWQFGAAIAIKSASFAALGAGQLLVKGGKRTSRREFVVGRSQASVSPQAFAWESLREPVRVESFAELAVRLGALPPAALRPRRFGEDFHVCAVAGVEEVAFRPIEQALVATVRDGDGGAARVILPFVGRARQGFELFAAELGRRARDLRFVSGRVRLERSTVVITPVAAVFERETGRTMIQPWVDRPDANRPRSAAESPRGDRAAGDGHLAGYLEATLVALGEVLLVGLGRAGEQTAAALGELRARGEALGLARFLAATTALQAEIERKRSVLRWDSSPAVGATLDLASLTTLATQLRSVVSGQ
jgi:hypothetical protein